MMVGSRSLRHLKPINGKEDPVFELGMIFKNRAQFGKLWDYCNEIARSNLELMYTSIQSLTWMECLPTFSIDFSVVGRGRV